MTTLIENEKLEKGKFMEKVVELFSKPFFDDCFTAGEWLRLCLCFVSRA